MLFEWKPITEMITDGFTKALPRQKFRNFVQMVRMVDITTRLETEKRMETLKETLKARKVEANPEITVRLKC